MSHRLNIPALLIMVLAGAPALADAIDAPVLPLRRTMVPPWLARQTAARPGEDVNGKNQD